MPIYGYRCLDCGSWDQRVAGLDDEAAICIKCEGLMLRVADNILGAYFEEIPDLLKEVMTEEGLRAGGNHVSARRGKAVCPGLLLQRYWTPRCRRHDNRKTCGHDGTQGFYRETQEPQR